MQNFNKIEAVVTEKNAFKNSDFFVIFSCFLFVKKKNNSPIDLKLYHDDHTMYRHQP